MDSKKPTSFIEWLVVCIDGGLLISDYIRADERRVLDVFDDKRDGILIRGRNALRLVAGTDERDILLLCIAAGYDVVRRRRVCADQKCWTLIPEGKIEVYRRRRRPFAKRPAYPC